MKTGCAPVGVAAALLLATAVGLAGCGTRGGEAGYVPSSACYAPLACGPMYPVAFYPYVHTPYLGYLHDTTHTVISTDRGRTSVTYRPYSPPIRPVAARPAPAVPKPAAPKPAAPKPAAPKPAAPKPASSGTKAGRK